MTARCTAAVVLAAGAGSRMRREDAGARLDPAQAAAAAAGAKALIPDALGRPFLDHALSALADGGITDACLVVGPDSPVQAHYAARRTSRLALAFVTQPAPLGTADAVARAATWMDGRAALVCNADNIYPAEAVRALVALAGPGLVAFDADALVAGGIPAERLRAFALLELRPDGTLERIIEKPTDAEWEASTRHAVSMNLWRVDAEVVRACREVPLSPRGERELPQAVQLAVARGARLAAVRCARPVPDLSQRGDVAAVAERLAREAPTL
ncbi:MAG: NTP transferase domain-containing protein [Gemmatimonadales bacterium]|nr:NTP transferase domain-containing protein [Gemmatimonadales bacterium]